MDYVNSAQGRTSTAYLGATTAVEPSESPSVIRNGVTNAEQLLSGIHESISLLEKRLDTVLRPVPPQVQATQNAPNTPTPVCSHVTGRMNILNDGFSAAISRLQDLASRVEV